MSSAGGPCTGPFSLHLATSRAETAGSRCAGQGVDWDTGTHCAGKKKKKKNRNRSTINDHGWISKDSKILVYNFEGQKLNVSTGAIMFLCNH